MIGDKKTLPLWRRRRPNLLALERALARGVRGERHSNAERAVIGHKLTARRAEPAKRKVGQTA